MEMMLTAGAGERMYEVEGHLPPHMKRALMALSFQRREAQEEDLLEVSLRVTQNEDGTFAVLETTTVKVVVFKDVVQNHTLEVVNENEHCWV